MSSPITAQTVEFDLCIGCGICAALCPSRVLKMEWNQYGEYSPIEVGQCASACGLCLRVCPFSDHDEDEDSIGEELYGDVPGISHQPETGYYLNAFAGYSETHRPTSASGGLVTWLLERLLSEGMVDHVVCVAPTGDPNKLFTFMVFDTVENLRAGSGSAYYPVEVSGVVRQILDLPGRYAVTGLPCFIKAIRLAQKRNSKLQERIIFTIGLVCGQLKSRYFTDYIAALAGVQGTVSGVRYRGKDPGQPVTNYSYTFMTEDGAERKVCWRDGIAGPWKERWFTPNACNYCDDVFAECADVTCMDAWLPEYSKESLGTNLIITRSAGVQRLIEEGRQSESVSINHISLAKVLESQAGVIETKRRHLAYRLLRSARKGYKTPRKRVVPEDLENSFLRREIVLIEQMQATSRELWSSRPDATYLQKRMWPYQVQMGMGRWISRGMQLSRIIRRTQRGYHA